MIRYITKIIFLLSFSACIYAQNELTISSPDGNVETLILFKEKIYYQVSFKGKRILDPSPLSMTVDDKILGHKPSLKKTTRKSINNKIYPVWGTRREINDRYNELTLEFEDFHIRFRIFNNGVAYRFITDFKNKEVIVRDEEVAYRFQFGTDAWILQDQSYESIYQKFSLDADKITNFNNTLEKVYLPVIVQAAEDVKVAITEAGLRDYPSLFLKRGNDYENYLTGIFEKYAISSKKGGFSNYLRVAEEEENFIAKTNGSRKYPWRLLIVADKDSDLVENTLVYQLSDPDSFTSTEWIKPGKVAWEWWNDYVVEGEDFIGGVNTRTYLYYIDFAAKNGLEYILVDWLWTDKNDLTLFNPDVNIREVINYGKKNEVGVFLWCPGHTLHRQLDEALDLFSGMGAAGVKVDFFGREDQTGIRMYEDIAREAAKKKLLVNFHGCTKPTGLSRTFPNIINYEAVLGNEYNKLEDKCTAAHKVMLPFTRALQGPMDFTPGGMRNRVNDHAIFFTLPLVHGTRCNEMALYVIYNEPLKMMCDAPSVYEKEPEITSLISKIPTSWEETIVLNAEFGEYLVIARRTGEDWYLAGISGENTRKVIPDLNFLEPGIYESTALTDGLNAGKVGIDYQLNVIEFTKESKPEIVMKAEGGFLIHMRKLKQN